MKIDSDLIEKLFEDSKSKLKEEYESFITKIKEESYQNTSTDII